LPGPFPPYIVMRAYRRSSGWIRSFFAPSTKAAIVALIGQAKYDEYGGFVDLRSQGNSPLPRDEKIAIWTYTSSDGWYQVINEELWEGNASQEVTDFSFVLDVSLSKTSSIEGTVFRGYTADDLDDFLEGYAIGTVREFAAFTSTTKEMNQAFVGNVLFVISAHSGHDIEPFSAYPYEREVLFGTNSNFRVLAVEKSGDSAVIELEQVEL
jgi:hypothetical protein